MLSRKTLGVAGAAILGSVALLAANPANAVINLNKGTGGVTIAKETLLTGDTSVVDNKTYYDVERGSIGGTDGEQYNISVEQGVAFGTGNLYLRIALGNMLFNGTASPTIENSNSEGTIPTAAGGGGNEDSYMVWTIPGDVDSTSRDVLTLTVMSLSVLPDAIGTVTASLHRDAVDAALGINAFRTQMHSSAVQVIDGLEEKGTSGEATADVASGFAKFVGGKEEAQIGYLRIKTADGVVQQSGGDIQGPGTFLLGAGTGIATAIEVTFKGDFMDHKFSVHDDNDCSTGESLSGNDAPGLNEAKTELTVTRASTDTVSGTEGTNNPVTLALCIGVGEKNTKSITDGDFTATVEYEDLADAKYGRPDQIIAIGNIGRNGTTVHLPYLTTDERYNQRIVIVNRGAAAAYSMSFESEDGIMTAAGMYASGTLAADSTTVFKTGEAVTITGGPPHRASGTLSIVSRPSNISVATNQTNRMDGSTDTVVYQ
jgi:hypothetical protein